MRYQDLVKRVAPVAGEGEARSMVRMLLEDKFGLSFVDVCCGAIGRLTEEECAQLEEAMVRLETGEPVQYVIGEAWFMGRKFKVEEGVLIPRPETEEVVWKIKNQLRMESGKWRVENGKWKVLDVGCGSGCISVSVALEVQGAKVTAWDLSEKALRITKENADRLGADVEVVRQDALNAPEDDVEVWDAIVSNPPYICNKEKADMEATVLDYEPHEALFVPDDDPLLFYREIAKYALHALSAGGLLIYEINQAYGKETIAMLEALGFVNVELAQDCYGKDRIVSCVRAQ